jgi:hypothetical protein
VARITAQVRASSNFSRDHALVFEQRHRVSDGGASKLKIGRELSFRGQTVSGTQSAARRRTENVVRDME